MACLSAVWHEIRECRYYFWKFSQISCFEYDIPFEEIIFALTKNGLWRGASVSGIKTKLNSSGGKYKARTLIFTNVLSVVAGQIAKDFVGLSRSGVMFGKSYSHDWTCVADPEIFISKSDWAFCQLVPGTQNNFFGRFKHTDKSSACNGESSLTFTETLNIMFVFIDCIGTNNAPRNGNLDVGSKSLLNKKSFVIMTGSSGKSWKYKDNVKCGYGFGSVREFLYTNEDVIKKRITNRTTENFADHLDFLKNL